MNNEGKTYRIYNILSKPLTFVGLTMDEWGVATMGAIPAMYCMTESQGLYGLSLLGGSIFGVISLKKFKKRMEGFSFKSFLYVHGYWPKPSSIYPSWKIEVYAK